PRPRRLERVDGGLRGGEGRAEPRALGRLARERLLQACVLARRGGPVRREPVALRLDRRERVAEPVALRGDALHVRREPCRLVLARALRRGALGPRGAERGQLRLDRREPAPRVLFARRRFLERPRGTLPLVDRRPQRLLEPP